MKLSGLLEGESKPIDDSLVVEEAMKCLVNIIVKAEAFGDEFIDLGGAWPCMKLMEDMLELALKQNGLTRTTTDAEIAADNRVVTDFGGRYENIMVPVCRLLFSVSRPGDSKSSTKPRTQHLLNDMRERGLLATVSEWLFFFSHAIQTDRSIATRMSLGDLIRIVINLTVDLGALGSHDTAALTKYFPNFPRVTRSMQRFFQIKAEQFKDPVYVLHQLTASAFVNVPDESAGAVLLNEDGTWPAPEILAHRLQITAQTLCDVLMVGINKEYVDI